MHAVGREIDRLLPFLFGCAACRFGNRQGYVVLDQVRTVDRERLLRRLGRLPDPTLRAVLSVLREMFEP